MRRSRKTRAFPVVTADAIEHRALELEGSINLARYHARGDNFLRAAVDRLPEPGSPRPR